MSTLTKRIVKLGAIALAIGLTAAESASAQYGGGGGFGGGGYGGGFGGGGTGMGSGFGGGFGGGGSTGGFGGMASSTTSGAFGQRSVGGMPTGGGAGSFTGSNQNSLVTGQLFNMNLMNNAGVSGIGNFQTSAFVGGGGASSFVGGLANRGISVNQNGIGQRSGVSGQFGGQYAARQFGGGAYGQQNNRQSQLAGAANTRASSRRQIQTSYKIGFAIPSADSSAVSTKLSDQLARSQAISSVGGVSIQLDGKTAVLRGTVATDHDRELAALLAMLEPGVSQVRNELEVQSASPQQRSVARSSASSSSATSPRALAASQN